MIGKISHMTASAPLYKLLTLLIAFLFWALPTAVYAKEITYTGNGSDLQNSPDWYHVYYRSFFPSAKDVSLYSGNKVIVNYNPAAAGAVNPQFVFGGLSESEGAAGNSIILLNGYIECHVQGGFSLNGKAANNNVHISGGTVGSCVSGGMSVNGSATGNAVIIRGGVVEHGVYGGYSYFGDSAPNTVTISGKPNLAKAYIMGGFTEIGPGDAFTGNTLNLESSGISIDRVSNFENYFFNLPEGVKTSGVMLSVAETVDLKGTVIAVAPQGSSKLREGDKIALIHSAKGVENSPKNTDCKVKQDGTLYEFSIYTDSKNLWAKVTKIGAAAK